MKKKILILFSFLFLFIMGLSATANELVIPDDVKIVTITEENFEDYFEIVSKSEEQTKIYKGKSYQGFFTNIKMNINILMTQPHIYWNYEGEVDAFKMPSGYWGISSNYETKKSGVLFSAFYDDNNKILYSMPDYVINNPRNYGNIMIEKYETAGLSVNQQTREMEYDCKVQEIEAKFKRFPYITVFYNNEMINFDQNPVVENGRTLVPVRAIFEKLGATVSWDGVTQTVTATDGKTTVSLIIDDTKATKNGEIINLDVPAKIINNRTLVPVRFVSDCFGVNVDWNQELQRVILTK